MAFKSLQVRLRSCWLEGWNAWSLSPCCSFSSTVEASAVDCCQLPCFSFAKSQMGYKSRVCTASCSPWIFYFLSDVLQGDKSVTLVSCVCWLFLPSHTWGETIQPEHKCCRNPLRCQSLDILSFSYLAWVKYTEIQNALLDTNCLGQL